MVRWVTIVLIAASLSLLAFVCLSTQTAIPREFWLPAMTALLVVGLIPALRSGAGAGLICGYSMAYLSASLLGQGKGTAVGGGVLVVPISLGAMGSVLMLRETLMTKWWNTGGMIGLGVLTAFFSGPPGGVGKFVTFLREVLGLSPQVADAVNFLVRKGIHLGVYGSLALCAGLVAWQALGRRSAMWVAGLGWGLGHAILDETTQATTTVRTGSVYDVLLDLAGMSIALGVLHWRSQEATR